MNNDPAVDANDARWLMSALADGEVDDAECGRGCAAWSAAGAAARERWHAYHLIGDVLRSEDLASRPAHDRAFLQRLSARLDAEPAVLAPQPQPRRAAVPARRAWAMPAALAAGVMALATVLVVAMRPDAGASAPTLAAAPAAAEPTPVALAAPVLSEGVAPGGRVVRDAQLDRYLRAHRDYATALPGSLPGGSGRSVATVSFER